MTLARWLRPLAARLNRNPTRRTPQRPAFRPRVEGLEDRSVPAVLTVTNVGDNCGVDPAAFAGTGTLRQALVDATATPGADTIQFALPDALKSAGGWWTIQPQSLLPVVSSATTIDGWSQTGAGQGLAPRVVLDGTGIASGSGLVCASDCTVRGLSVGNFKLAGIELDGGANSVQGCYVGLDPTGTTAQPNNAGIYDSAPYTSSVGNTIGGTAPGEGNVISGNGANVLSRGYGVTIRGNLIGTNAAGTAAINQTSGGLRMGFDPVDNFTEVIADNLISGNAYGIQIDHVNRVSITGNKIGTDITGMFSIGNVGDGVIVGPQASDVVIGGTDPGSGNLISSNRFGLFIGVPVTIQGNLIGTDATGAPTLGNRRAGIDDGPGECVIGGPEPGAGNVIAGNGTADNNDAGVVLGGSNNLVQGNVIHDNNSAGVDVYYTGLTGNTITQNSIYHNLAGQYRPGMGIDILVDINDHGGVTPNDPLDADTGPNGLQNFPVLTAATRSAVTGTLNSTPNATFRIEFFANTAADPTGYGEGERYLGFIDVATDADGNTPVFSAALGALFANERYVTATATNLATGDTSEFSQAFTLPENTAPTANPGGPYTIAEGGSLTLSAAGSSDPDPDTLTYSWDVNGDGAFGDATGVSPTLTWTQLNALGVTDGPAALAHVRVRVGDGVNPPVTSGETTLTVTNTAPTAVLSGSGPVTYGQATTVTFTSPYDPSQPDTAAGFHYAYAVDDPAALAGATYASSGTSGSAAFTLSAGTHTIYARIIDKDDGYSPYSTAVTVNKAAPTVTVTGGSFVYDGQPHPATGSVTGVNCEPLGTPTFTYYYLDGDGNWVLTGNGGADVPVEAGYYRAVGSFAGNDNYNPGSKTAYITIAFEARSLTDLSRAFHAGRTIPIKIQLLDANGNNLSSSGIDLTAIRLERVNADGTRTVVSLQDAGNANPNNLFRYDAALGGYIFNLSTKGLAAGDYEFFWMAEGDPTEHELGFRLI